MPVDEPLKGVAEFLNATKLETDTASQVERDSSESDIPD
jgi:hypothetical protein